MNILNEVRLAGADLCVGESVRIQCPVCQRDNTLSVTRDEEGLLYNCYRASCHTAGRATGRSLVQAKRKPATVHPYTGALHALTDDDRLMLAEEVGFDDEHVKRAKARSTDEGRIAYPILSPLGKRRGFVLRSYNGAVPKALTRMDIEEPHSSYYPASRWERGLEAWLVEDIPSAVRAARYVDCIALAGCSANDAMIAEIASQYRRVVWALDADATVQALRLHKMWSLYFEQSRVQVLERDLKDESEETLKCLLS